MILDLGLAFLAGLISFASTCVLPLVPAYITWMGGRALVHTEESTRSQQLRVFGNAFLFVLGFATAFTALGASAGLLGSWADLHAIRPLLLQIAGVVLVLMGIALLAWHRLPWLMRERRFDIAHRLPRAAWASYVVGLAFAIGWTPCVGPILAAILLRAGAAGSAGQGAVLLATFSLGLGVPFLAAAGVSGLIMRTVARARGVAPVINAVAAVFLIAMGLLIYSNRLTMFNSLFPAVAVTTPFDDKFSASPSSVLAVTGAPRAGDLAPDFRLQDLDGRTVTLSGLKGKPVLVNFWATWCVPCRQELPLLFDAAHAHEAQGLQVLAIDWGNESAPTVRSFWNGLGLPGSPLLDPQGTAARAYGVGLKTTGLPVTVFIDRQGRVRSVDYALTQSTLDRQLSTIL